MESSVCLSGVFFWTYVSLLIWFASHLSSSGRTCQGRCHRALWRGPRWHCHFSALRGVLRVLVGRLFLDLLPLVQRVYWIRAGVHPNMQQTDGKRLQFFAWFCPLAVLFAMGLFCPNQAHMYCIPAFLQFMKEGNGVLVFALSCVVGLQVTTRARYVNGVWILAGASMAVSGQVHYVVAGFLLQLKFGECGKDVMEDWMMKSHVKLGALLHSMFLSPMW